MILCDNFRDILSIGITYDEKLYDQKLSQIISGMLYKIRSGID